MPFGVLLIGAIVLAAVVLMALVRREQGPELATAVVAIEPDGLCLEESSMTNSIDCLVAWSSIFEITVVTRRQLGRTWFGFEMRTETHGLLSIDGSQGLGEAFLAECHRFPGFNHVGLDEALRARNSRFVCYSG